MNREDWLDRVKGIACIIVFLNHFFLTFRYVCLGLNEIVLLRPFHVLINGNYGVCIFLLISAYVISVPIYRQKDFGKVQKTLFKRYPRLMLPVFFSSLFAYFLYTLGGYYNQEIGSILGNQWLMGKYTEPLTLKNLFLSSLIKVWWNGDASFNAPFWMLQILFFGTFLTVIVTMITAIEKQYGVIILVLLAGIYTYLSSIYLCFILGMLLAYLKCKTNFWEKWRQIRGFWGINIALLIASFCLPGYADDIIEYIDCIFPESAYVCNSSFYNIIGSFLLIFFLMGMERIKKLLEKSKVLKGVSQISFSIYLIHWPVICSLSCFLYLKLQGLDMEKNIVCTIIFGITVIIVAIVAKIFYELVEKRICNKAVAKICERYFEKSISYK